MAEDNFKSILFTFILFALFGWLLLTSVVQTGSTYGKNMTEVSGGAFDMSSFNQSINNLSSTAQTFQGRFSKQSVWSVVAGIVVTGLFGIANDLFKIILWPFSILNSIMINVLHIPDIVTSIIWALIILTVVFGIWRLIKVGD
jgi:hypothetical protein